MIALLAALLAVVNSPVSQTSYGCDAVTAAYLIPFAYQQPAHLTVTSTTAGAVVTTLTNITDFTLSVNSTSSTATLTLLSPSTKCPVGSTLKIARIVQLTQPNGFRAQTSFKPELHEQTYDLLEMQIQQVNDKNLIGSLAVPLPVASGGTGVASLPACTTFQLLTSSTTALSCTLQPGAGAISSGIPGTALYVGARASDGTLQGMRLCDFSGAIAATALTGSLKIITGVTAKKIFICGGYVVSSAAVSVKFVEGTGTNCATGQADVTGAAPIAANGGWTMGLSGFAMPFTATATNDLCVFTSGAATLGGWISYSQQVP